MKDRLCYFVLASFFLPFAIIGSCALIFVGLIGLPCLLAMSNYMNCPVQRYFTEFCLIPFDILAELTNGLE